MDWVVSELRIGSGVSCALRGRLEILSAVEAEAWLMRYEA